MKKLFELCVSTFKFAMIVCILVSLSTMFSFNEPPKEKHNLQTLVDYLLCGKSSFSYSANDTMQIVYCREHIFYFDLLGNFKDSYNNHKPKKKK